MFFGPLPYIIAAVVSTTVCLLVLSSFISTNAQSTATPSRKRRTSLIIDSGLVPNTLRWARPFPGDWEILVYDRQTYWEACFFNRQGSHEHLSGSSFDEVRHRAEFRIRVLE